MDNHKNWKVLLVLWMLLSSIGGGGTLSAGAVETATETPTSEWSPPTGPAANPFYLNAEERHLQGEAEDAVKNPNRLQRPQNAVLEAVPAAPLRAGAAANGSNFNLRAEDWAPPGAMRDVVDDNKKAPLKGQVSVRLLSNFNIELIVDESMSMRRRDCPGGASRWEWCGMQLQDLSNKLAPFVPRGFTLTTFAGLHHVYRNATPKDLNDLFNNPFFTPGTRLSQPLTDRLQEYFNSRQPGSKPLLIVVITDGVPSPRREPYMVAQTLITASKIMKDPREVTVVFFQIGGTDGFGRAYLSQLDNNLVSNGARFDFVKTVSFEELQQSGLTGALINTIKEEGQRTSLSSSRNLDN